jgi:hypothetical protein
VKKKGNIENLKPFKKGESGNPKGYPKGLPNSKNRLQILLSLVQKVENKITGEEEDLTVAEQMDIAIVNKAMLGDVKAYEQILDRLEGKTTQTIDLNNNVKGSIPLEQWIKPKS